MKEIWKYIDGFNGRYSVSSFGRVRAENRWCYNPRYGEFFLAGKMLKPSHNSNGYLTVTLALNGRSFPLCVHRIVAQAFIPNPKNKPQVNHINGNRADNNINNLEWCTQSENNLHSYRKLGRIKVGLKGENNPVSKIVLQIKNGIVIAEFCSVTEAQTKTGIARQSIGKVANKKLKSAGGYKWEWKKDDGERDC